jgi:hypothetical protein
VANGDFVFVWPVYILESPDGTVAGHNPGQGIVGLSLYTDHDLAQTFADGGGEWTFHPFNDPAELLEYLGGLTGEFNHVVIDPSPQLNAPFIPIPHFISALQAAG